MFLISLTSTICGAGRLKEISSLPMPRGMHRLVLTGLGPIRLDKNPGKDRINPWDHAVQGLFGICRPGELQLASELSRSLVLRNFFLSTPGCPGFAGNGLNLFSFSLADHAKRIRAIRVHTSIELPNHDGTQPLLQPGILATGSPQGPEHLKYGQQCSRI